MGRPDYATAVLEGVALALLALLIAVAPVVVAGGVLLSGSPPLHRLATDHLPRLGPGLTGSVHIDRERRGG